MTESSTIEDLDVVKATADIPGDTAPGALSGGAEAGETGTVVSLYGTPEHPNGYTIEIATAAEPRLVDARPEQVRLVEKAPCNRLWRKRWSPRQVKALREKLGLTQTEMGRLVWEGAPETAQKNLARIESGEVQPSAAVARTLRRLDERDLTEA